VPGDRCIELKSLKYYMIEFRNRGILLRGRRPIRSSMTLVAVCQPRGMTVVGDFSVRGASNGRDGSPTPVVTPQRLQLSDIGFGGTRIPIEDSA
jgi:hypothetical protein